MGQIIINTGNVANDGLGTPLRNAFDQVNYNFTQLFNTGPSGSNIVIANNTISVTNTNGNLILATNGVGSIVPAANFVPDIPNVRSLGAGTNRFNTVYAQYINANTGTFAGNVYVAGNLQVTGNVVTVNYSNLSVANSNITLATGAANAAQANGGGVLIPIAGANFTYNYSANSWNSTIAITAPTFIGDGANLTNVIANVQANALLGNTFSNSINYSNLTSFGLVSKLSATGNLSTTGNVYANVLSANRVTANYLAGNGSNITNITANAIVGNVPFALIANTAYVANLAALATQAINADTALFAINANLASWANTATIAQTANASHYAIQADNANSAVIAGMAYELAPTADISVIGNITTDGYFIGDGSQLTGINALANTGNVTFSNQVVIGTGDQYGGSGLYLAPGPNGIANLQYLQVRGGDYPTHIHLDTGNNAYYDQYFGNDGKYLKLVAGETGAVEIGTASGQATWTFDANGNLNVYGTINANDGNDLLLNATSGGEIDINSSTGVYVSANTSMWQFNDNGNLTLPSGTPSINYSNGSSILDGIGGNYGNSNVAAYLPVYTGNLSAQNIYANGGIFSNAKVISIADSGANGIAINGAGIVAGANVATILYDNSVFGWTVNQGWLPAANVTYNLGRSNRYWNNFYAVNVNASDAAIANSISVTNSISVGGNVIASNISTTGLNSNSIVYVGANGLLTTDSTFTYTDEGGELTLTVDYLNSPGIFTSDVYGQGNLILHPSANSFSSYLDIYLTTGPDIHIAGNSENVIIGRDSGANVTVGADGNVIVRADNGTPHNWTFSGTTGSTIFPTLPTPYGDQPSGFNIGPTMCIGDGINDGWITSPDGNPINSYSSIVIQPGQGYDDGNGGKTLIHGGRGGPTAGSGGGDVRIIGGYATGGGTGGDVELYLGNSANANNAGTVRIVGTSDDLYTFNNDGTVTPLIKPTNQRTGYGLSLAIGNQDTQAVITGPAPVANVYNSAPRLVVAGQDGVLDGEGGDIYLWAGQSGPTGGSGGDIKVDAGNSYNGSQGGTIKIRGGRSNDTGLNGGGGFVEIIGGQGDFGADVTITSGLGNSAANSANVTINTPYGGQWRFDNNGTATFPGNITSNGASPAPSINGFGSINSIIVSASGNIIGGNLLTGGDISATGDLIVENIGANGNISAIGDVVGGNILTTGIGGDITLSGGNIAGALRVITTPTSLANLTAVAGGRAFVNDGNLVALNNFGAQIGSGGSNVIPVWSDGTNWYIG